MSSELLRMATRQGMVRGGALFRTRNDSNVSPNQKFLGGRITMAILEKLPQNQTVREIEDVDGNLRKVRFSDMKLIKASDSARAAIMVSPDIIDVSAADRDDASSCVGITVVSKSGTVIKGPIGITTSPDNIRIGGMWKFNPVLLSAMPSTIMTPIPVLRFSPPLANIAEFVAVATAIGAMAGILG